MLDQVATNYNHAMRVASSHGQVHIVRLMLSRGVNACNMALRIAALRGYLNIVELIQERMNFPSS